MSSQVVWTGREELRERIIQYGNEVRKIVWLVAEYWRGVFEQYARPNAPWHDRTGEARRSLHAFLDPPTINELATDTVTLYLSHGVEYGLWLEIKYAGRYAIIWPTIEAHIPEIQKMLRGIFGR